LSSNIHRLLLERNRQNKSTHELIKLNGMISIRAKRSKDLVAHLAKVVAGQQLSTKAADSIWKKIETLLEENNCSIEELFLAKPAALRASSGLSRNKVKAISGMVEVFESGRISKQILFKKNYDELVECITSLWGFGKWSADMVAMSFFAHKDVWPDGDLAIRKGIEVLSGGNEKTRESILSASAPYRSYLARHIWKGFNRGLL
jgi:DNA-3-methyladenine glycosylase II